MTDLEEKGEEEEWTDEYEEVPEEEVPAGPEPVVVEPSAAEPEGMDAKVNNILAAGQKALEQAPQAKKKRPKPKPAPVDPNRPKKKPPRTAFWFFGNQHGKRILKDYLKVNPDVELNVGKRSQIVAAEWKKVPEEQKTPYIEQARVEKEKKQKQAETPTEEEGDSPPKKKMKKTLAMPVASGELCDLFAGRPKSPYETYWQHVHVEFEHHRPGESQDKINNDIARSWVKPISNLMQKEFTEEYNKQRELYLARLEHATRALKQGDKID